MLLFKHEEQEQFDEKEFEEEEIFILVNGELVKQEAGEENVTDIKKGE
jgi:uncharacterized protein YuzB (UPF0349 family)